MGEKPLAARRGRLISVDALRALAASAVLLGHIPHTADNLSPKVAKYLFLPFDFGYVGVSLFLVLSGFCIHLAVARRVAAGGSARSDWGRFWKRRFWRLYPPYAAAIALSLAVYYTLGPERYEAPFRITSLPWDLGTHLLLIHNLFADYSYGLGDPPFWTLGLEEQLYALYFLLLLFRGRGGCRAVLWITGVVTLLWQCVFRFWLGSSDWVGGKAPLGPPPLALGHWLQWAFGFWLPWALGAVAAEAYAGIQRLPGWCDRYWAALVATAVGFGLAPNNPGRSRLTAEMPETLRPWADLLTGLSNPAFGLAAFILLNRWVNAERDGGFRGRGTRALAALGVMSYSLYLTHVPALKAFEAVLPFNESLGGTAMRYLLYTPLAIGVGAVFFYVVERHFLHSPRTAAPR